MERRNKIHESEQSPAIAKAMASPPSIDRLDILMLSDFHGERLHPSGTDEIIHVQQGQAEIAVGKKKYLLGPRDTFILPRGTKHRDLGRGNLPCRFHYIFFHWPGGRNLLASVKPEHLLGLPSTDKHHIHLLVSEFEREYISTAPGAEDRMRMLLMETLLAVFRFSTALSAACSGNAGSIVAEKKRKHLADSVRSHLLANYSEMISLDELARRNNTSSFHLSRTFSREFGISITDMLTSIRMENAKEMLRENLMSIKEIAAKTGYSTANYFSRSFRRACGISPSEYQLMVCKKY
jgi:AraC-like DNA-binding protein/mannose-6-phosphate isomerase-like protein (cupin superfamily)